MTHSQKPLPPQEHPLTFQDRVVKTWLRFQRFMPDIAGVFVIGFALMILMALFGWTEGALLNPLVTFLSRSLASIRPSRRRRPTAGPKKT